MYRLKEDHEHTIEIQKSRFICYLHKTLDEEAAKEFIISIQKLHPNATHHCYAFIIGEHNEIQRSNDDGEPGGTAGMPMLDCLMKQHMQDITAVVVRYFGGIKLGAGGLVRAYSKSVSEALKEASLTQKKQMKQYRLSFSYELTGKLDHYFRTHDIRLLQKTYEDCITYEFLSETPIDEDIQELTSGRFFPEFLQDIIIDADIKR